MVLQSDSLQTGSSAAVATIDAPVKRGNNAAFYYHPDGYETNRKQLMGRHAAGEAFLQAFVRYAGYDKLYSYAQTQQHFEHFLSKVKQASRGPAVCSWIPWTQWSRVAEPGCLFMPSPTLKDLAWQRRHGDQRAYSICGITHTTATQTIMDAIGDQLTAPLQPWDAVICTSQSVKSMVLELLNNYGDYLQDRFGLRQAPKSPIQLPIIPLGVECQQFDPPEEQKQAWRKAWREKFKIADDAVAFLFVGRLSSTSKTHPLPMFLAMQQAAVASKVKLHLILSGWFPSQKQQEEFIAAARQFCPAVVVHIVDGRAPDTRKSIWFAADVFTALSDNIQETFGLTPIEAMAAGLPCVVSDWDGYKETVRHGLDGFRIPTWMPPSGSGIRLALGHANHIIGYEQYVGATSLFTAVDVASAASAYAKLAGDAALRRQMSENAKKQAREGFDWRVIIPQYQKLWSELGEIRAKAPEICSKRGTNGTVANPLRDDPSRLFQAYSTQRFTPDLTVSLVQDNPKPIVERLRSLEMNRLGEAVAGTSADIEFLLARVALQELPVREVLKDSTPEQRAGHALTLLWLVKFGILQLR